MRRNAHVNLTPSCFASANDSMINRKQRHRKQCEMRDGGGVSHSHWAWWKHTWSRSHTLTWWRGVSTHEILNILKVDSLMPTVIHQDFFFFSHKSHSCHLSLWLLFQNCSERNGILYQLQLSMQKTAARLRLACHGSGLISPCLYLCSFSQRGRSGNHEI